MAGDTLSYNTISRPLLGFYQAGTCLNRPQCRTTRPHKPITSLAKTDCTSYPNQINKQEVEQSQVQSHTLLLFWYIYTSSILIYLHVCLFLFCLLQLASSYSFDLFLAKPLSHVNYVSLSLCPRLSFLF